MSKRFNIVKDAALRVLFPPACPICGRISPDYSDSVCRECAPKLPYITKSRCVKCSKAIEGEAQMCSDCISHHHSYVQGFSLWQYNPYSKKMMSGLKYGARRDYVNYMACEIVYHGRMRLKSWNADAVVPVPLHISKYRKRGYNQAEVLAAAIADTAGLTLINDVLFRVHKTKAQKHLDDTERSNNLKGAFLLDEKRLKEYGNIRKIIIIDDIYTTGSTINACAVLFKQAGIQSYFLTACIGDGF